MDWDLKTAMLNSYNLIIRGYDPILYIKSGEGLFAHNPSEDLQRDDVEGMLEFFEEEEDYVRCIEIKNFINKRWNSESINKK